MSKMFGGAHALDQVDLTVLPGEVHGLLGQNGSGKSTLIKVLAGVHDPEPGASLEIYGHPVKLPLSAGEYRRLGLAFVHQNLGLVPSLSVLENLRVESFATEPRWYISWEREKREALRIFEKYGLDIDPAKSIGDLPPVQRAMVAIVRAVADIQLGQSDLEGQGVLVLDEPTPFLPAAGIEQLFELIRTIVADGASVIFVSHDVDEVMEITDRATILRDGKVAGTLLTKESTKDDFVERIIGRRVQVYHIDHDVAVGGEADISVKGLSGASVEDVEFSMHRGEILGLTGLIGSGFSDVPYLLYGATKAVSGELNIAGETFQLAQQSPNGSLANGIVLVPGDRIGAAAVGGLPMTDNLTQPVLANFWGRLGLHRQRMEVHAHDLASRHNVTPNDPSMMVEALSGGNQQKVIIAKWLQGNPALCLLDEPTQGVDVGARQQVFMALDAVSTAGAAVICASTDYEQLEQICDRVLVFSRGRVVAELTGAQVVKETIAERCYHSMTL
ncbi:MAG: sugar ABC transporter ATP-binding protein [Alphaproteobacteria bacterium]|nr:sugar ABC transporter ATP-binding protein [Alphaproteobacteria bacterium]